MGILRDFEWRLEGAVEGLFARFFRSGVQPVELGKRLVREVEDGRTVGVNRVYVPNVYVYALSPAELRAVVEATVASVADGTLVVAGTGYRPELAARLAREAFAAGAGATMLHYPVNPGLGERGLSRLQLARGEPQATVVEQDDGQGPRHRSDHLRPGGSLPGRVENRLLDLNLQGHIHWDIAQRNTVQEGHFSIRLPDRQVDCRVSFAPVMFGQKLVCRILDQANAPRYIWFDKNISPTALQVATAFNDVLGEDSILIATAQRSLDGAGAGQEPMYVPTFGFFGELPGGPPGVSRNVSIFFICAGATASP